MIALSRLAAASLVLFVIACGPAKAPGSGTDAGKEEAMDSGTPMDAGVDAGPADAGPFANATAIMVDAQATAGMLQDTMTPDYYSFTGKAGQRVLIAATAHSSTNATDETITDTVVTLYLPDMMTVYAQDDDEWPRYSSDSQLFTELPMDGTYYYTVEDCNGVFGPVNCAPAANVVDFNYTTEVLDLTAAKAETVGVVQGGTAPVVPYTLPSGGTAGEWSFDVLDGDFTELNATQVFSFTPPTNTAVTANARMRAYFWLQPIGAMNGDGSKANVQLTVKDSNGNVVATANQQYYLDGDNTMGNGPMALTFPLFNMAPQATPAAAPSTLGETYTLEVQNEAASYAAFTNFYFMEHAAGGIDYGTPETEFPGAHTNDTSATPEMLSPPTASVKAIFADGDIINSGGTADVDWYEFSVPTGTSKFQFACDAARAGSGLQGFTAAVLASNGTTSLSRLTETNPPMLNLENSDSGATVSVAGNSKLFLRVSATGQDSVNTGTYYSCGVYFQ
jgi:hypothetical protein